MSRFICRIPAESKNVIRYSIAMKAMKDDSVMDILIENISLKLNLGFMLADTDELMI
jgi:hypothetical protein